MQSTNCNLTGVPETMLWTLHNRASEAMRPDGWLRDPDSVRIYKSLRYDYRRSFGRPDASHAVRSLVFDQALKPWLKANPGGMVVELACGLETQFQRCDDGLVRWLCVDVPESIALRERFLAPNERCRHLAMSALDLSWMDMVDPSRGLFITVQGLLMYFDERQVKTLLSTILTRFPCAELMFDTIPHWFSRMTTRPHGLWKTKYYRTPPMPWGIAWKEVNTLLHSCSPAISSIQIQTYPKLRGLPAFFGHLVRLPVLRNGAPLIVHVRTQCHSA